MTDEQQLNNWFTYHAPTPEQVVNYEEIRHHALLLALAFTRGENGIRQGTHLRRLIDKVVPEGVERTYCLRHLVWAYECQEEGLIPTAIRDLRGAVMWANAAIAVSESETAEV